MSNEREVPVVAFVECVKVHHVELANIDGEPCTVGTGFPRLWRRLSVMGAGLAANIAGKKKLTAAPRGCIPPGDLYAASSPGTLCDPI